MTREESTRSYKLQIDRAYRLALDHGHEWADWLQRTATQEGWLAQRERLAEDNPWRSSPDDPPIVWPKTWPEVQEAYLAAQHPSYEMNGPGPAGIAPPHVAGPESPIEEQCVHHTTSSGRLTWRIQPDGHVSLYVCRPLRPEAYVGSEERGSMVVLAAYVLPDGDVGVEEWGPALERHWVALSDALCLVAPREARIAASPILALLAGIDDD